jgi:hypothetical protein
MIVPKTRGANNVDMSKDIPPQFTIGIREVRKGAERRFVLQRFWNL